MVGGDQQTFRKPRNCQKNSNIDSFITVNMLQGIVAQQVNMLQGMVAQHANMLQSMVQYR